MSKHTASILLSSIFVLTQCTPAYAGIGGRSGSVGNTSHTTMSTFTEDGEKLNQLWSFVLENGEWKLEGITNK